MTTKTSGGKITGLLALTVEAQVALETGDWVHITGPYEVDLADGSKPVLGHCSVANTRRLSSPTSTTYPSPEVPGDVTVEARGLYVKEALAAGALSAGIAVGVDVNNRIAATGAGVAEIGILLTDAAAADDPVDVLVR